MDRKFFETYYETYNREDPEALSEFYHQDVVMRTAQGALPQEVAQRVPGGLVDITWMAAQALRVQGQYDALVADGTANYAATGTPAHIRLIVFLWQGERWVVFLVTPQDLWETYRNTVWTSFVDSLRVF